jgi:methionine synthase II (cobalamin-independent)
MAPPFRVEQIGSLIRPACLLAARSRTMSDAAGTYIKALPTKVQGIANEAIACAIQRQEELYVRPFMSGEYERHIF